MKGKMKKIAGLLLATACITSSFAGCGGGSSDAVAFWVKGTEQQLDMYDALVSKFNETYGAEHGIKVETSQRPETAYDNNVLITAGSSSGPDIFLVTDANIKSWIKGRYFKQITSEFNAITDIELTENMDNAFVRLRYDENTNSSNPDDPLYGVPVDVQPTALYYNKTKLEAAGIKIISVDEEDMDAWNAGGIADRNGVKKEDLGIPLDHYVPKKGFYRSQNSYFYNGNRTENWVKPTTGEVLIFNNRIAMNWDEIEDISMLFTATYNPKSGQPNVSQYGTTYGYFTEWWFNYAWSVGGDCLTDLTGNGTFNFSLLDPNPNYVVVGESFTGRTGTTYEKGETISFLDKMNIAEGETLVPDDWGDYLKAGGTEKAGVWSGIIQEMNKGESSAIAELPSTKEAFLRYLKLGTAKTADIDGDGGLAISPNPSVVNARGLTSYFLSQEVVFVANTSAYMAEWSNRADTYGFEWDLAPLVEYKRYADPSNEQSDEVVAQGKTAGHSNAISLVVREGSKKTEQAVAFLKWVASVEGQKIRAGLGFFPTQKSLIDDIQFPNGIAPSNVTIFGAVLDYQKPGDWWYLQDSAWVERWCTDLNASLRNGKMTYAEWLSGTHADSVSGGKVVVRTNQYLKNYKYGK